ncbi:hypothetical protein [Streptomyces formicae]|uniref:hypothetical protein n=1 Tax=Streptomyces formicae TaxID=1616117 RepID=UPI003BB6B721
MHGTVRAVRRGDKSAHGYAGAVNATWQEPAPGVMRLPSGRLVRGRGLRRPLPAGPAPDFAVSLLGP